MTTFYIVRHGETEYNIRGIAQGHLDSPLTEKGIYDVNKLAKKFKEIRFDLVFSSDLLRAKKTAEIIMLERKLAVETTELLRERNFGKFEGKPFKILKTFRKLVSKLEDVQKKMPDLKTIENDEGVVSRLITFLRETSFAYPGKTILVVTHGGVIRQLLIHIGFAIPFGAVSNLGYVKLETDGVDFQVKHTEGIRMS